MKNRVGQYGVGGGVHIWFASIEPLLNESKRPDYPSAGPGYENQVDGIATVLAYGLLR
jgi:hypothetical protein